MSLLQDQYDFRSAMLMALREDLLGPGAEDEVIDESPLDRYLVGVIHPSSQLSNEQSQDDPESAQSERGDNPFDAGVALAHMRYPSSFGMSFAVDVTRTASIEIASKGASYESLGNETPASDDEAEEDPRSRAWKPRGGGKWRRVAASLENISVNILEPENHEFNLVQGLTLIVIVRDAVDGIAPITVILRNTHSSDGFSRAEHCWFQPRICVTTAVPAIVSRVMGRSGSVGDEDLESYALLFRDARRFAAGHGCAAEWARGPEEFRDRIETVFVPDYEVRLSTPRPASDPAGLRMSTLAQPGKTDGLHALVADYRSWIAERQADTELLPIYLRETGARHLDLAARAAERIEAGIRLIETDEFVSRAFVLMNQAMMEQRARQDWIRSERKEPLSDGAQQSWRPFQIAFILLNLEGLADRDSPERDQADLLWFPTGGGKTEAYLGLIALSILIRRLRNPDSRGVTAMMRYTLRLLTLQQFERASTLVCALESLRRRTPELKAGERISIGLWVGQGSTPNTLKNASLALRKLQQGQIPDKLGNPVQLMRCPWCGVTLDYPNYAIAMNPERLVVSCGSADCEFSSELPVVVVDEDVYRERPSLLIGTVDKFAMMAWNAQVSTIFSSDGRGDKPDLIVQDELHLIAGPLGTMVGLYETAVDAAATVDGARPKMVASTATIRRAQEQIRAVFNREAFQFPPPGLDPTDSFFAIESTPDQLGTRQYVGLLAPGSSAATLMIRTYAALLDAAARIEGSDEVRDPYWTLVGYFNSLRVLGGAYLQVMDDVSERLDVLARRRGEEKRPVETPLELTSRVPSGDIPHHLGLLGTSIPDPNSPSVVLATNMISVGVDVDRLGLMAVMGQPQSTAEYIQSTSRVGRKYPGLVITMYNAARSRDRSHFESFLPYHQSLYREVEATSATPFASRARDRGLHGVLVSMARLLLSEARLNEDAARIEDFLPQLEELCDLIAERVQSVDPDAVTSTRTELHELLRLWEDAAARESHLKYQDVGGHKRGVGESLLIPAGDTQSTPEVSLDTSEVPWRTLQSLRDVDAESVLSLISTAEGTRK